MPEVVVAAQAIGGGGVCLERRAGLALREGADDCSQTILGVKAGQASVRQPG